MRRGLVAVLVQVQHVASRLRAECCELCVVALCVSIAIVLTVALPSDTMMCNAMCSSESSTTCVWWRALITLAHTVGAHSLSLAEVELSYGSPP